MGLPDTPQETGTEMVLYRGPLVPERFKDGITVPPRVAELLDLWAGRSREVATAVMAMCIEALDSDFQVEVLASILAPGTDARAKVPEVSIQSVLDTLDDSHRESPTFTVLGLKFAFSTKPEGEMPVFAIMDAVVAGSGEKITLGTGSSQTVAAMFALRRDGQLPVTVRWREARKPTAANLYPLNMEIIETAEEAKQRNGAAS